MYSQLRDYDNSIGFYLRNWRYRGFRNEFSGSPNTSRLTLKHHLFNAHVPKKLRTSIRANSTSGKKVAFNHEMLLRRVDKVPISATSDELGEADSVDYGDRANFPHFQDTFRKIPDDNIYWK